MEMDRRSKQSGCSATVESNADANRKIEDLSFDSLSKRVDNINIGPLEGEQHPMIGTSSFPSTFVGEEIASDFLLSAET